MRILLMSELVRYNVGLADVEEFNLDLKSFLFLFYFFPSRNEGNVLARHNSLEIIYGFASVICVTKIMTDMCSALVDQSARQRVPLTPGSSVLFATLTCAPHCVHAFDRPEVMAEMRKRGYFSSPILAPTEAYYQGIKHCTALDC